MIFKPQNGTPEEIALLVDREAIVNKVIHDKGFINEAGLEVANKLHGLEIVNVLFYYDGDSPVSGTANEELKRIRLNTKSFGKSEERDCGILVHECLHLVGYDHKGSKDYTSVPYSVGFIAEKVVRGYSKPKIESPKWIFAVIAIAAILLYFIFR